MSKHSTWKSFAIAQMFSTFVYATVYATLLLANSAKAADKAHIEVEPISFDEISWTDGFWHDRLDVCYNKSVPSMWELMRGTRYKPYLQHFLIAAGRAEGGHHGAKWNDGDFYKWMEAAIATVAITGDQQLLQAVDESIEAIGAAQRGDGYIHTPVLIAQRNGDSSVQPFQDRHAFEMYNMGHLLTTACMHHKTTGKDSLLNIARKAADFLIETFKSPTPELARNSICPSHYMGAIDLYRETHDPRYLELGQHFLRMRNLVTDGGDDNQDRVPFIEQREIVGHSVRSNYLYAGVADIYAETGNQDLMTPLLALWENMTCKKLYITGACGALYDGASPDGSADQKHITRVHQAYGRNYQLPSTTAHNETCANIGNLMWSWRMFLLTGEAKYVDVLELALYNSILSGVSLSGTEFFYVNPLRVVDPLPTNLRYPRTRQPFFTSFCCPPNLLRTLAAVGGYAYSKTADTVWVNLYGSNKIKTELLGHSLQISQQTNYPWMGRITIEVEQCPKQEFAIKLRIPHWASTATLSINDTNLVVDCSPGSYAEIRRDWRPGDVVALNLPMRAKLMQAHPLVEEATNQVAAQRGPVVYCLESNDLPAGIAIEQVVVPQNIDLQPRYDADLLQSVVTLEGVALSNGQKTWSNQLYREVQPSQLREFPLKLIPYYAWSNRGNSEMSVWLPTR